MKTARGRKRRSPAEVLASRLDRRTAHLGVIGLGYVGLPLAVEMAEAGFQVTGIDIDERRVKQLQRGVSYIQDVPTALVKRLVREGKLNATTDFSVLRKMDTVNICVPTPLSKQRDPDVSYIVSASEQVAKYLHSGQLIVLESTTYPGTTEELILPLLSKTGMVVGKDFFLAFSPERVDPGNPKFNTRNIPKVVGGVTPACTQVAVQLYRQRLEKVVPVSSTQVAEMVKLLENTFRSVNIGLVNELALMCSRMGIDVWEVIESAATKPFGFMPFYPGPGLGGHCQDGDEFLFVKKEGGVDAVRMNELATSRRARKLGDVEITPLRDVEVLSFDPESRTAVFRPATHIFRRPYSRCVNVRSAEGRTLTVTDGHPLIVENGHGIESRRADQTDPRSRLVLAMDLPEGDPPRAFDLIEALSLAKRAGIRVIPRHGLWIDHWNVLRAAARRSGVEKKDVAKANSLPLSAFLELERGGFRQFTRADLDLATGRGSGHQRVPCVIPVGQDLARLVGYYLSEGCLTLDGSRRTRWTFGAHEDELIADLTGTLDGFGIRWSLHRVKRWKAVQIKVSSNLFGRFFGEVLGCGRRSDEMRMPPLFLGGDSELRWSLLGALINGDGSVDAFRGDRESSKNGKRYRHRCSSACVSYFTSSPRLLQQVTLLMHSLRLVPSIKKGKPELRLFGEEQLRRLAPRLLGRKRERLEGYLSGRSKPMSGRRVHKAGAMATVEPMRAVRRPGRYVYSIEVPGTQTYVTSYGLVSHNCIPIDPFYLSWKARASGFEARFIELAGHVNGHMPEHVVSLVSEALNRVGKAVRGSKVLVLGVAYKADIDDTRESPSLDIMEKLREAGARIDYCDPFVPILDFFGQKMKSVKLTPAALRRFDSVVIATAHKDINYGMVLRSARSVVDTRNALKGRKSPKIVRL